MGVGVLGRDRAGYESFELVGEERLWDDRGRESQSREEGANERDETNVVCENQEHRKLLKNSTLHDVLDVKHLAEGCG